MQEIRVDSAKRHNFARTLCKKVRLRSENGDMKVKTRLFFILTLLMVLSVSTLPCFVQHAASTQLEPCAEWMKTHRNWKERCEEWKDGFPLDIPVFSPDGGTLAGVNVVIANIWSASTGKIIYQFRQCGSPSSDIAFSPDGRTCVVVDSEDRVCVWSGSTGQTVHELVKREESVGEQVNSIAFSPDGRTVANAVQRNPEGGGFVRFWDVSTGKTLRKLEHPDAVRKVAFRPDGRILASWSEDSIIRLWSVSSGEIVRTIENIWAPHLVFSPDCRTLAVGASHVLCPMPLCLWDVETGEPIRGLNAEGGVSTDSIAFSSDGRTVASGGTGRFVHIWDVSTGELLRTIEARDQGYEGRILSLTFGSGRLTGVNASGKVLRWNVESAPFQPPHPADVNCDGIVDIRDIVTVAAALGQTDASPAYINSVGPGCSPCPGDLDVNDDGTVDIRDLVAVTAALGETVAGAPAAVNLSHLSPETVQQWLSTVERLNLTDSTSQHAIRFLEQLLLVLAPKETALLANYPNPFNPETWIPYQLGTAADVTLRIYAMDGTFVRRLSLGHKAVGVYQSRSRAAYWDGRNQLGEPVASGPYFYTLSAGDFTATRKMLIRK